MSVKVDTAIAVGVGFGISLIFVAWGVVDYLVRREDFLFPNRARLSD